MLLFILISSLFSQSLTLKNRYCINDETTLYSHFFDKNFPLFKVTEIPSSVSKFDIPSLHVKAPFEANDINVTDTTHGIITFQRNCDISGKKVLLEQKIQEIYTKEYPCIQIHQIEITTKSNLPADFQSYHLLDIGINASRLKHSSGSFWALFQTQKREKKIYFNYTIEASISVFKAKHNMHNDKILSKSDFEETSIKVDNLSSNIISCEIEPNLITKSYISQDELLSYNKIEIKKDLLKGSHVRAFMVDGALVIGIESVTLEDANIGDKIRIKTEQNKFFYAKLISKSEAMILK